MRIRIIIISGYALAIFGIFILIIAIGMGFDPDPLDSSQSLPIAVGSFAITVPGLILLFAGKRSQRRNETVTSTAQIARSYRRISISDIAEKQGVSPSEALRNLSIALRKGLVTGYIDRSTDEFFTEESVNDTVSFRYCPSCGAALDRVYLKGETISCKNCGTVLS